MVFSSIAFLFFFLPLVLLTVPLASIQLRNLFLLFFSLVFYAWGEGLVTLVLLLSILTNFLVGLALSKANASRKKMALLSLGITGNLLFLGYFKYTDFLLQNLFELGLLKEEVQLGLSLPIGISFFTFQGISYLFDVYRKEAPAQKNLLELGLYISLFPQLIAGPIVRYKDVANQLVDRKTTLNDFTIGGVRFIQGLAKKVLIANNLALIADEVFAIPAEELAFSMSWLGIVAYTFQIYFDFSGYSDMAIGLGRMFGFRFKENFNFPYLAKSIREFWRRWHISLSNWFRDYLYIPLGGNRKGEVRTYLNLILVFFLTGLWHGASWNFVLWGLLHGTFLILERKIQLKSPVWIRQSYTFAVVLFAWVLFRAETLDYALNFYRSMLGMNSGSNYFPAMFLDPFRISVLLVACLSALPFSQLWLEGLQLKMSKNEWLVGLRYGFYLLAFVFTVMELANGSYNPFIYYRF